MIILNKRNKNQYSTLINLYHYEKNIIIYLTTYGRSWMGANLTMA